MEPEQADQVDAALVELLAALLSIIPPSEPDLGLTTWVTRLDTEWEMDSPY
jgi:hypothetical protein